MRNTLHVLNDSPEWLDLNQAEQLYPYSRRQFWYWITGGTLTAYRPTKRKIILKRSEIDKFLESKRVGADLDAIVDGVMAEMSNVTK
ncbi:MAG: helix-turn-helix domain-containing protein [Candidatus Binatia bacterium]